MAWYKTGTVSITNNTTTVTGATTNFAANGRVGDGFLGPDGRWYEVVNIASATVLSIQPAYLGPTVSSGTYAIAPIQGYNKDTGDKVSAIVSQYGLTLAVLGNSGTASGIRTQLGLGAVSTENVVPVIKGGTGSTTPADARTALGLGATSVESVIPIAKGGTAAVDAPNARANLGLGTVATENTVPQAKGGTGRTDGKALFSEVGVQLSSSLYTAQGMFMGWNSNTQGEGHFVVNRGGGTGGFTWRSVNSANTASGPTMTYAYDGTLTVPYLNVSGAPIQIASGGTGGTTQATARNALGLGSGGSVTFASMELVGTAPYIDFHYNNTASDYDFRIINDGSNQLFMSGDITPRGILSKAGINAARGGTRWNMNWTGSNVDFWVDATYVGSVSLFTSDYRIKKFVKNVTVPSFLDRIDAYRIVNFQKKVFGDVFRGDGTTFQGLIAHEVQEINPLAVSGKKDGVDEDGNPVIQQLEPIALITDLMGAIKELRIEVNQLKSQLARGA